MAKDRPRRGADSFGSPAGYAEQAIASQALDVRFCPFFSRLWAFMSRRKRASMTLEDRFRRHQVSTSDSALLVIDAQESFRHQSYWRDCDLAVFIDRLQVLINSARARGIPIVQVFHCEEQGAFSLASGHVMTLAGLALAADAVFHKRSHSALIGSGLDVWLVQRGIRRLIIAGIRTEQCCETTTRHASDMGYEVNYVTEATLTFPMTDRHGREWSPREIKTRTELVLDGRFARIVDVEGALTQDANANLLEHRTTANEAHTDLRGASAATIAS